MRSGGFQRRWASSSSITHVGPDDRDDAPPEGAPLGGNRAEALQRLQVGLFGLGSMVLLIGLASVIGSQADLAEERAVPEAAPTTEPTAAAPQRDPLADAGIVPGTLADPTPTPTPAASATDAQTRSDARPDDAAPRRVPQTDGSAQD